VYRGQPALHPDVATLLMRSVVEPGPVVLEQLTPRELDVLRLIARGRSNKRIALALGISEKTVKTHVGHLLAKLGVTDRTQAALYAVRTGMVDGDGRAGS
jgi:DNA-binding NarL/FixJ family response regulator